MPKSRPPPVSTGAGFAGLPVPDGRVGSHRTDTGRASKGRGRERILHMKAVRQTRICKPAGALKRRRGGIHVTRRPCDHVGSPFWGTLLWGLSPDNYWLAFFGEPRRFVNREDLVPFLSWPVSPCPQSRSAIGCLARSGKGHEFGDRQHLRPCPGVETRGVDHRLAAEAVERVAQCLAPS